MSLQGYHQQAQARGASERLWRVCMGQAVYGQASERDAMQLCRPSDVLEQILPCTSSCFEMIV